MRLIGAEVLAGRTHTRSDWARRAAAADEIDPSRTFTPRRSCGICRFWLALRSGLAARAEGQQNHGPSAKLFLISPRRSTDTDERRSAKPLLRLRHDLH
jgi:hypothetical protein